MKKISKVVLSLSLIIALVAGIWFGAKYLKINKIICTSQFGPCSQSVQDTINKSRGIGIFESFDKVKKNLASDPRVSEYTVRFIIPNSLSAYVIERKGVVALGKQGVDKFLIVDNNYKVIGTEKNTLLPLVNINNGDAIDFNLGESLPDSLSFASNIERQMYALYGVKLATVYNDKIEVKLSSGPKVLFPLEGEIDVLMGSLNLILSRLNNASGEIRIGEVDLRYKNPVIR